MVEGMKSQEFPSYQTNQAIDQLSLFHGIDHFVYMVNTWATYAI